MKRLFFALLLVACGYGHPVGPRQDSVFPTSAYATRIDGAGAFAKLRKVQGAWEATTESGKTIHAVYKEISNGSTLVESFVTPSGKETMTMYYADNYEAAYAKGSRLLLTHYCAQGNQARLQATQVLGDTIEFRYLDATNFDAETQGLLIRLSLTLTGDTLVRKEVYQTKLGPDETTLTFKRVTSS